MKRFLCFALVTLCLLGCTACKVVPVTPSQTQPQSQAQTKPLQENPVGYLLVNGEKKVPEYVLEIDGTKVDYTEFRFNYLTEKEAMLQGVSEADRANFWTQEKTQELLNNTKNAILRDHLTEQGANKDKVTLSDAQQKEVDSVIKQYLDYYGQEDFIKELHLVNIDTVAFYRTLNARSYQKSLWFTQLYNAGGKLAWGEDKMDTYCQEKFKKDFREYVDTTYLRCKHILISFVEGESTTNSTKTLEKANQVYQLVTNGTDFDQAIKTYNQDPGASASPDGYTFTEGDMVKEFYEGTKALAYHAISQPVMSKYGYHIILRLPLQESFYDSMKNQLGFGSSQAAGPYSQDFYQYCDNLAKNFTGKLTFHPAYESYLTPDNVH